MIVKMSILGAFTLLGASSPPALLPRVTTGEGEGIRFFTRFLQAFPLIAPAHDPGWC
jgi:hypothetical protein